MINSELNAIKLDADSGLQRDIQNPLPEEQIENYKKGLIGEYDFYTIFYDVFLMEDLKTVVAMGPPLLNLEKDLLPISLNINGRIQKFEIKTNVSRLSTLATRLPDKLPGNRVSTAEISFANGFTRLRCAARFCL